MGSHQPLILIRWRTWGRWRQWQVFGKARVVWILRQKRADPEPIHIEETDANFSIEWKGRYRIEGTAFVYVDRKTGATRTILGYPTQRMNTPG
mgnify:CR=1 FL=1